ncbi:hypothetical protein GUJ93_ZPchr0003g17028 [Zizania palustris]|uniref:Uncharacterized protein n=1 Tax=Zizania palustris TaxID=103762 RepID=A0A8J5RXV4_ZIZPA|nr:hypothetical protein GUJ93_ZPchr0003g17028 [Zizania palustris]
MQGNPTNQPIFRKSYLFRQPSPTADLPPRRRSPPSGHHVDAHSLAAPPNTQPLRRSSSRVADRPAAASNAQKRRRTPRSESLLPTRRRVERPSSATGVQLVYTNLKHLSIQRFSRVRTRAHVEVTVGEVCISLSRRRALRLPLPPASPASSSPAGEPCALPLPPESPARSLSRRRSLRAPSPTGEPCALPLPPERFGRSLSRRRRLRAPSPAGDVYALHLPPATSACSLSRRARVELSAGDTLSHRRLGVLWSVEV